MDDKGLYARAHQELVGKILPLMRGQEFTTQEIWQMMGIQNKKEHTPYKEAIALVLYNLTHVNVKPMLKQSGKRYKIINRDTPEIKWWIPSDKKPLDIRWPRGIEDGSSFGFEKSIVVYPGDGIVIAGEGQQGKTAFALNFLVENMDSYEATYISSEFNDLKFRDRITRFKWVKVYHNERPKFEVLPLTEEYEDVVDERCDNILIFDWLKLEDDMFKMRGLIAKILKPLKNGIALIIIQKRPYKQYGEGGGGTIDLASVYFTLSRERLKVEKVKVPGEYDPNYKQYGFKIVEGGSQFHQIREVKNCPSCKGRGDRFGGDCSRCYGKGYIELEDNLYDMV